MSRNPPEARSILVIRYRFIGDTILTVPFLRNLREAYPDARIDVLVGPQSGEVLKGCPYINELIVYDTTRFHKYDSAEGKARSFWSYVWELRKRRYDTAFILKRSLSSAILALLIGCKNRIGYAASGRSFLLSKAVAWNQDLHEVESTLDVLRAVGIEVRDKSLSAWLSQEEKSSVATLIPELSSTKTKVLFHAAAAHPDKTYPLESWAKLIQELCADGKIIPFFSGSAQDKGIYDELEKLSGIRGVNAAGKLDLRQSMALYERMDLAICTDSGPAHLAAAVGTPVIALFGPTDPRRWRPWSESSIAIYDSGLSCRPCNYKKSCEDRRQCLTELSALIVLENARRMLSRVATVSDSRSTC